MLGAVALLFAAAALRQEQTPALKRVEISPEVAVYVPMSAVADQDDGKSNGDYKAWAFQDGSVRYLIEIMPSFDQAVMGAAPDSAVARLAFGLFKDNDKSIIRRQRDIALNGWLGLEVLETSDVEGVGEVTCSARTYAVQNTLYAVAVAYPSADGKPPSSEAFLASLTVEDATTPGPFKTPGPVFTDFTPMEGGFSIGMPANPKVETLPFDKAEIRRCTAAFGNRTYVVSFTQFGDDVPEPTASQRNEAMNTLLDTVVKGMDGAYDGDPKPVARDELEWLGVDCSLPSGLAAHVEVTYADHRAFVVLMSYPAGHAGSPDIETFFNSFRLAKD